MVRHNDKEGYSCPKLSDTKARWLNYFVAFPKGKTGPGGLGMFKMLNIKQTNKQTPEQNSNLLYVFLSLSL